MELVNNYMSGSTGTITKTSGPLGFGAGSDTGGTGGINFSTLLDAQNAVQSSDQNQGYSDNGYSGIDNQYDIKKDVASDAAKDASNDEISDTVKEVLGDAVVVQDDSDEIRAKTEEDIAVLLALVNSLPTDKASNGVELVTSKITTEAAPPSVTATNTVSDASSTPIVSEQNLVPSPNSNSVTVDTRNGADEESAKKAALEAERNGGDDFADAKVENKVDATKMSKEEILKSLEGQGKLVTNANNTPNGTPSMETHGPTGRPPESGSESKMSSKDMEKGPTGQKTTTTAQETKTAEADPAASIPMSFASQAMNNASQAGAASAANTNTANATSETMMMRTTESNLTDDLSNLLASRFPSQNGQLTIELDPEKLGKITINVSYDSGHAAVSISATNQKTVELLTQSASAMANIIQQKTGQQTDVYIPNTQQSNTKQDMTGGRESNENADQQSARQREQQAQSSSEVNSNAFIQQMRLGLV